MVFSVSFGLSQQNPKTGVGQYPQKTGYSSRETVCTQSKSVAKKSSTSWFVNKGMRIQITESQNGWAVLLGCNVSSFMPLIKTFTGTSQIVLVFSHQNKYCKNGNDSDKSYRIVVI